MSNQTIGKLGQGEYAVGTSQYGGYMTNFGNRYVPPTNASTIVPGAPGTPGIAAWSDQTLPGQSTNTTTQQATQTNTGPKPDLDQTWITDANGVRKTLRSGIAEGIADEWGNI